MEDFIDSERQVQIEQAAFRLVNEERIKRGIEPLKWLERIASAFCSLRSSELPILITYLITYM